MHQSSVHRIIIPALLVITFLAFIPSLQNGFTNWDDPGYITRNEIIRNFSMENVTRIFSTLQIKGNYHPLTVLAYNLEYQLFQNNAAGYHWVQLLLHCLATVMVYRFILELKNSILLAIATALLFGIHPMHVESVAWASALKDVLYALFYFGGLWSYVLYLKRGKKGAHLLLTYTFFICSLLSKGMAVTFPIALLLIDYVSERRLEKKTLFEKLPFILLSIIFGTIAILAQRAGGAVTDFHQDTLMEKIVFASTGFVSYIIKLVIPFNLSAYYPYPDLKDGTLPAVYWLFPLVTIGILIFTITSMRKTRSILFGMGLYTLNVVLVLQVLQVGGAIMADRYTYVSSVGIFYLMSLGGISLYQRVTNRSNLRRLIIVGVGVCYGIVLIWLTWQMCGIWKDSQTLWSSVIERYDYVPVAYDNRGNDHYESKKYGESIRDFTKAIELNPRYAYAYYNRGLAYAALGVNENALSDYDRSIVLKSDYAPSYQARGLLHFTAGRIQESIADLSKAIQLGTTDPLAFYYRANAYVALKNYRESVSDFSMAINLKPDFADAYFNRGNLYAMLQQYENAIADYTRSLHIQPGDASAHYARGVSHYMLGRTNDACADFRLAGTSGSSEARTAFEQYCGKTSQ